MTARDRVKCADPRGPRVGTPRALPSDMNAMNDILAPEILAHLTAAREPRVGDLAVFVDYKGREVGATVTRIEHGQVWGRCGSLGLHQHGVYANGDMICRDAKFVARAI